MSGEDYDPLSFVDQERSSADKAMQERLQREKEANDLRHVMGSKQGRRFVHRLLDRAGVYRLSINFDNPHVTDFNEGGRNQGLTLLSEIMDACPERYMEMLAEHKTAKERDDNRNADARNRRRR